MKAKKLEKKINYAETATARAAKMVTSRRRLMWMTCREVTFAQAREAFYFILAS
jgi:hypothetical protein